MRGDLRATRCNFLSAMNGACDGRGRGGVREIIRALLCGRIHQRQGLFMQRHELHGI
jgi:hypothetical protein